MTDSGTNSVMAVILAQNAQALIAQGTVISMPKMTIGGRVLSGGKTKL